MPDDLPCTRGVLRRIRIVTQSYDPSGEPLDTQAQLRDVTCSPHTWRRDAGAPGWVEDGMLVALDVGP